MSGAERRINDILIAVRRTGAQLFGIGLYITHRHAEPEGGMEFKVNGFTGLGGIDWGGILGQREFISHLVAGAGWAGVEQRRWLIVSDVFSLTENRLGVIDFRTGGGSRCTVDMHVTRRSSFDGRA